MNSSLWFQLWASAAVLAGWVGEADLSNAFLLAAGFSFMALVLGVLMPKHSAMAVGERVKA